MRYFRSIALICGFLALPALLPLSARALAQHTASTSRAASISQEPGSADLFSQFGVAP